MIIIIIIIVKAADTTYTLDGFFIHNTLIFSVNFGVNVFFLKNVENKSTICSDR